MPSRSGASQRQCLKRHVCVWRAGLDPDTRLAANNTELGRNAGCLGLKKENQAALMQGMVTALKAKARNMRAFLWAALGKDCIRMRQDSAKSEVIQNTLF